ncbi:MAG: hypothetical protein Q7S52_02800 [bacterium]|nr:hypothetical protein [bacterium]
MPFLLAIWLFSLVVVIGIAFYARFKQQVPLPISGDATSDLDDFFVGELRGMSNELLRGVARFRPHGERVIIQGGVLIRKGHNMLIEKAFGRIAVEKGKASSFFLKRIAEHKDELRGKIEDEA